MTRGKSWIYLVLVAVIVLVPACTRTGAEDDGPQAVELKTYEIPHGYENEVRTMLSSALGSGENRVGRANLGPGGMLVVVAPPGIQTGVGQLVKQLRALDVPPPMPSPVRLTYWLVAGQPQQVSRTPADVPRHEYDGYSVVGGASLAEVEPALHELAGLYGPTEFALVEQLRLASVGDGHSRTTGRHAWVEQRASEVGGEIVADIGIRLQAYTMETQVKLTPGQFVVLGQSGYAASGGAPKTAHGFSNDLTLYYVIAADLEP